MNLEFAQMTIKEISYDSNPPPIFTIKLTLGANPHIYDFTFYKSRISIRDR